VVDGEYMTEEQYKARREDELARLYSVFCKQRDDWVQHRSKSGVEDRWRRALAMYLGDANASDDTDLVDRLKNGPSRNKGQGTTQRSRVVVNIVRPKVDQAVARMCEILLPVDDRNWGIKPTPVPESVSKMLGNQGPALNSQGQDTGMTADQAAQMFIREMKESAKRMETEIDDVLNQCGYNGEQREMLEDGVLYGTGVILGPFPKNQTTNRWIMGPDGRHQMVQSVKTAPISMSVSPWEVWFDPACGNDHHRGAGFYNRRYVTRKELRSLSGVPGYDSDAIRKVLLQRPTRTNVIGGLVQHNLCDEESYEMWVYVGEVDPEQMESLSESVGDPLENVDNAMVIIVGEVVIGAMKSWVVDGTLPVDVWCYRKSEDSPFGYGLPDELVHQQRVVTSAWRQVMDNARASVGGQIVMKKKGITPQNGSYDWEPFKIWLANDDLEDVRKAMEVFEFNSHLTELLAIAKAAMEFADQETSMPQIMGGEKGSAPETVGGMIMLYNNANVVLRLRVKLYDDNVTRRHIRRHYDWQMANNPRKDIKGDMEVDARGSTALLEKDIQNQATLNLANVTSNPRYAAYLDPKEELRTILKAFKVTPEDIMLPDAKIEENIKAQAENPPQDPNAVRAQAQIQVKQMDLQDKAEDRAFQERKQQAELAHKGAALQYNATREESEREIALTEAQLTRDLALLKAASDEQENDLERSARQRLEAMKIDSDHQLFNAESALRVQTGEGI